MFTHNQLAILQILTAEPDRAFTLSEIGRILGKAPGVFQRGLNALESHAFISSRREANLRLLTVNAEHPLYEAIAMIARGSSAALPSDVYMSYASPTPGEALRIAETRGSYTASALKLLIIAGPNGAGKTTFAREFLPKEAACHTFINADYIAHALSPFSPAMAAMKAGKVMLRELDEHMAHRRNIAIETTLSGKRYARTIPRWQAEGYAVKLIFLSLPSVELALARVAGRVRQGGHAIPEETIRRRFEAGNTNFECIYKPLVNAWAHYDNSGDHPVLLAEEER